MKKILIIVMLYIVSMYGITITVNENPYTIEDGLAGVNSADYVDVFDSCGIKLERHINSTKYHYLADTVTDSTKGTDESVKAGIYWLNDYITNLGTHFVLDTLTSDSVHFKPDTLTSVSLDLSAEFTSLKSKLALAISEYNSHCAKDTSDFSDVHITASVDTIVTKLATTHLSLSDYSELSVYVTGSSVSTGATIFIDGSPDDKDYTHIDSIVVSANGLATPFRTTNKWKYLKVYCKYWTDGIYKLQIYTGSK